MNRLSLTLGLAAMETCWVVPWAVLVGLWTDPSQPRALLSPPSVLTVVLLGALTTHMLGRWAVSSRAARSSLVGAGVLVVLVAVRFDQYPSSRGLEWLGSIAGAVAVVIGEAGGPALAFALGLFLWWRGVRVGSQMPGFSDAEGAFKLGIGVLVSFALVMGVSTRPSVLPAIEAQTMPFVVGFFFVGLLTLALGRLESLRTRTRALAVNTQWLGVLVGVAGLVVLVALGIGQLLSFDVLIVATRPLFELLGQVLLLAIYVIVIPLAYLVEWLVYLLLNVLSASTNRQPPQLLQPADVDDRLQRLFAYEIPPELLLVLKAAGAAVMLGAALLVIARAAARWRRPTDAAEAGVEERDSVWHAGKLRRAMLGVLRRLFRRAATASGKASALGAGVGGGVAASRVSSVRELYIDLLRRGESVGVARAPATTPLEHLAALQHSLEPVDAAAKLTHAYVGVRYAEVEPSVAEIEAAGQALACLRPTEPAQHL
ncbi:MAG: DUF4129 domain-containing protein [Chloroflexota bacterium]